MTVLHSQFNLFFQLFSRRRNVSKKTLGRTRPNRCALSPDLTPSSNVRACHSNNHWPVNSTARSAAIGQMAPFRPVWDTNTRWIGVLYFHVTRMSAITPIRAILFGRSGQTASDPQPADAATARTGTIRSYPTSTSMQPRRGAMIDHTPANLASNPRLGGIARPISDAFSGDHVAVDVAPDAGQRAAATARRHSDVAARPNRPSQPFRMVADEKRCNHQPKPAPTPTELSS